MIENNLHELKHQFMGYNLHLARLLNDAIFDYTSSTFTSTIVESSFRLVFFNSSVKLSTSSFTLV